MLQSRNELIVTLFRETDRAQCMKTPLALILCGIDDSAGLGIPCDRFVMDEALREMVRRITRLLRCHDSVGQFGEREFGLVLPGCSSSNAVSMAERLNIDVFGSPVTVRGNDLRLAACYGIAGSGGRSSLVVLRNAEEALRTARSRGIGSIERCGNDTGPDIPAFLMPLIADKAPHC